MTPSAHLDSGLSRRALLASSLLATPVLLAACGDPLRQQATADGQTHTNLADNTDITEALLTLQEENSITLSLAAYDHQADDLYIFQGDTWTYEASIVKVPIALTLLRLSAFQERTLTDQEKALITASLSYSDNGSTSEIFRIFGGGEAYDPQTSLDSTTSLNKTYELLGIEKTRAAGTWGDNQTWAQDQLLIMRAIVDQIDWVQPQDAAYLLGAMQPVDYSQNWGVGVMQGQQIQGEDVTQLAVKNGWIQEDTGAWHINSVGALSAGQKNFSLALLTKGAQDQEKGYDLASQAIQTYFDHLG